MVSTPLKNISQNGNLPLNRGENKKYLNPPPSTSYLPGGCADLLIRCFFLVLKLKTRKTVATCDNLLAWVPVVWIPIGSPKMKGIGLLLRGIPIRIPNHRAPNQQLSIRWPKQWTEQFPKQWIEETLWQNLRITIKNIAVPVTCTYCQLITKKIGFGMSHVSLSAWKKNHLTNKHSYFMWDGNSRLSRKNMLWFWVKKQV